MASRDKWTERRRCPKCGLEGVAHFSEYPGYKILSDCETTVDSVPEGFSVTETKYTRGRRELHEFHFSCVKCGVEAFDPRLA
jgi:predicted RNA-binding Zn-ribbon protein involved in translation (DUF1610 family)